MDTLQALRHFVSIAETGSLSAAARLGSVATSTVTVALQQLENQANVRLITRSTRRLSLTYEGQRFLEDARRLLAGWEAAIVDVRDGTLKGPIKITAAGEFGRKVIVPIIDRFALQHPAVDITLHLADNVIELVDHHIDIALRAGPLPDSTLKTRLLLRGGGVVCASPAYWSARGVPERPEDLAAHNCLVHSRSDMQFASWAFVVDGLPTSVRVHGNLSANESEALRYWALAGRGILRRSVWGIQQDLQSGRLITALDAFAITDIANLYAVTPSGSLSQRVRTLIDYLATELQAIDPPGY